MLSVKTLDTDAMEKLLTDFKNSMHISHKSEDGSLKELLSYSIAYVEDKCGNFEIDGESNYDKRARELVINRTRYAYNEALEYFEDNFLSEIISLGIDIVGESEGDDVAEE